MDVGEFRIFRTYKDDDFDQGASDFEFKLAILSGTKKEKFEYDELPCFDVKFLPNWTEPPHPPFCVGEDDTPENREAWAIYHRDEIKERHVEKVIKQAMELGYLERILRGVDYTPKQLSLHILSNDREWRSRVSEYVLKLLEFEEAYGAPAGEDSRKLGQIKAGVCPACGDKLVKKVCRNGGRQCGKDWSVFYALGGFDGRNG